MGAISKGKVLGGKKQWIHEASDKAINTTCWILPEGTKWKGWKDGKALGKHVISLYFTDICQLVKIRDVKKLRQDIKNNLIIKDQMAILGCLLVCTFSNFLAPVLFAAHTVNNLDPGNKERLGKC